ncbi:MAG: glycoside hydrolase family 25 [Lachnospiraceae bacterium]|jgi:lysozyme|nr:glycoside hydrolase family 25 [Lachnospiraceae bacterium]
MRRNKDRHPSWREPEFEDELDLDEEPDGERDSDDGEFEDGDDEWAEEDDWSETWSGRFDPENRKLIIGGAAVLILIIVAVIVVFAIYLRNSTNERKAVEAQMNLENLTEEIPDEAALPEASEPPAADVQTEITVGALDDAQDPQDSEAAGNEKSGAEVTVAPRPEGETEGLTMGIDVSKYQGTIDWKKVKESGVEFAMVRVGYRAKSTGEIFEDPTARYNMQEAQAAGIRLGAYFFSSAVTEEEARAEAAFTRDIVARYKITYPIAYNCEDFQSPDSRQYGLDAAARTALACAFLDEIASAGYTPMFYASKGELEGNAQWNTDVLAGKYKIWVAQYPEQPYPQTAASSYSGAHAMWQYTSQGTVAGISRKTDVNVAYFGYVKEAEAKDETPAETVTANPEVGIIFTEVNETVTAKQETNLRSEPSTLNDDSVVGKLVHGDTATRTGIGHNGWSRLVYNGQTLYAVTSYLTTNMEDTGQQAPPQGPVYTPVNERVTAKIETNLRLEPSTAGDDTVVGLLHNGEVLTRTAVGDNGWSQLEYNGQTVYAVSSYLMAAE